MKEIKKINIELTKDIIELKNGFIDNGKKLFLVGGAVRDSLLGKEPKDFDLATDVLPDEIERIAHELGFKTIATGKKFGIINVVTDNDIFEVATFRSDSTTSDGRRPDSIEFTDMETDALRRDLTINALFFDMETNEVIDFVGGIEDLENSVVRTVGNARDRFNEDRLRILRAIRFAGRFNSELHEDIVTALTTDSKLTNISPERIRDEFLKGLKTTKSVVKFLELVNKFNLFEWVFTGLNVSTDFIEQRDPIILISWLLKMNDVSLVRSRLESLKFMNSEIKQITFLLTLKNFKDIEKIVSLKKLQIKANVTNFDILKFASLTKSLPIKVVTSFIVFKLSVTGQDATELLGVSKGPEMGEAINKLEVDKFKQILFTL